VCARVQFETRRKTRVPVTFQLGVEAEFRAERAGRKINKLLAFNTPAKIDSSRLHSPSSAAADYGELHWQSIRRHALAFAAVPKANARRSPPRRTKPGCMYYVYILRSSANRGQTDVGSTGDLKKRLAEHNSGKSTHTNKFKPWILEAYVAFPGKVLANKFESYLKTGSGRAFAERHFRSPHR
jgi:putative endonuclease